MSLMERPAIAIAEVEKSSTTYPSSPKAFEGHSKEALMEGLAMGAMPFSASHLSMTAEWFTTAA